MLPSAAKEAFGLLRGTLERCAEAGLLTVAPRYRGADSDSGGSARQGSAVRLIACGRAEARRGRGLATSALQLSAKLRAAPRSVLTSQELGLLQHWLGRLAEPRHDWEPGVPPGGETADHILDVA
jgi:hypothetical protein